MSDYIQKFDTKIDLTDDTYPPQIVEVYPAEEEDFSREKSAVQWSNNDGYIVSIGNTFSTLEKGYYSIGINSSIGLYFMKENISLDKLYKLPNDATTSILNDIEKFWTLEDVYKRYNRVFKRNYLLYSAPGTGKTSLINIMCQDLIEKYNGIVISLIDEEGISLFPEAIKRIRAIEPKRKIIVVIEDIDNFVKIPRLNSKLLNILDGNLKTDNLVVIATTNYIETMEERYVNRPSRFDRVIEFPLPNEESRRVFIEKTVKPEDIEKINIDKWIEKTKGFTIDHINELIVQHLLFGMTEEETFENINKMVKNNSTLRNKTSINKKNIGFDE